MKNPAYYIETYGCQMNEHDSEKISGLLDSIGYLETNDKNEASLIILNTCQIRENAELKVFGKLGALKKLKLQNPNLLISVCGCMMQIDDVREKLISKYPFVDIIFGTNNIQELPQLINDARKKHSHSFNIVEDTNKIVEDMPKKRKFLHKGLVNITYGCNNFCSYCVVPYTRGREKSRNPEDIIREVEKLSKNNYKEITLLGQNVNSYGHSLPIDYSFSKLLYDLNKINGIERIRFMTPHPKDLSDDLIDAVKNCDKVCEHFHLPIQSGSSKVLKDMNRKYTKEHYLNLVKKLRTAIPDIAITTDIIVGFPGETEEDFLETLDVVRKVRYDLAYTFLYSIRKGTPAAKMENQIPEDIKHKRFDRLLQELYPIIYEKNQLYINNIYDVLVDGLSRNNEEYLTGRTRTNKLVHFKGNKDLIGKIVNVKIINAKTWFLEGVLEQEV